MLKKPLFFWQNVAFIDETRVRISCGGIVRVFRKNGTRSLEKTQKIRIRTNDHLCFWSAIQSYGRKLLVKCPNKLNAVGYLKF